MSGDNPHQQTWGWNRTDLFLHILLGPNIVQMCTVTLRRISMVKNLMIRFPNTPAKLSGLQNCRGGSSIAWFDVKRLVIRRLNFALPYLFKMTRVNFALAGNITPDTRVTFI